jgi:hypothetical protein
MQVKGGGDANETSRACSRERMTSKRALYFGNARWAHMSASYHGTKDLLLRMRNRLILELGIIPFVIGDPSVERYGCAIGSH